MAESRDTSDGKAAVKVRPHARSAWTLPPEFWEIFFQVCILLTVVVTQVIFWYMCSYDHRHTYENIGILVVFYACDCVYLGDTILRVFHIRKQAGIPNPTWWEKVQKYSPTFADVASLLPLELLVLALGDRPFVMESEAFVQKIFEDGSIGKSLTDSASARLESFHWTLSILKLNRLIRLYQFPAFYRSEKKNQLRLNVFAIETIKLAICFACFLALLCHSIACIWFSMNCSGVVFEGHPPVCRALGNAFHSIYKYSALNQTDPFIWYLGGLHWSVMSLRNTGDRVLLATSSSQMVYSVITQFIGFYLTILLCMLSIHIATLLDLKRSKFFHEALGARNFAAHMELSWEYSVIELMNRSFNRIWKKSRGFTDARMKHVLPKRLQMDISMSTFAPVIEKSEILKTCFESDELEIISHDISLKHYFPNSFLVRPNAMGSCMFYILRGSVDILGPDASDPTVLFTVGAGTLIGESDAFFPRVRKEGVKTRTDTDVLKLSDTTLAKFLRQDAELKNKVLEIIKNRVEFGTEANPEPRTLKEISVVTNNAKPSVVSASTMNTLGFEDQPLESEVYNRNKLPHAVEISPISWLFHFPDNAKDVVPDTENRSEGETMLEQYKKLPETEKKYHFVSVPISPTYRWEHFVISTDSVLADIWSFVIFAVALIYSYGLPVCVMLNDESSTSWLDDSVDIINVLDLFFRLVVLYHPSEMRSTIPHRIEHLKGEFKNPYILLAIIPVIPVHHVIRIAGSSYRNFLYVRLHVYFVRLITLHLFFRKWEHDVRTRIILLRTVMNTIYISIYIIFCACLFCSFGCYKFPNCEQSEKETWVGQYFKKLSNDSHHSYEIHKFYFAFYLSLYWCLSTMFGIGYTTDYLVLVQKKETTLLTVHLVLSLVLLIYFFASLGAAISANVENKAHDFHTKTSLLGYLEYELTDVKLIEEANYYLELQRETFSGIDSGAQVGFLSVNRSMYKELLVSVVSEPLHDSYFFQGMSPHSLKTFSACSKISIFPPNTCLMKEGELVEAIHVIRRGYVKVYKGGTSIGVDILSSGQSFGEIDVIHGQPSRISVRSLTYVELIYIPRDRFEELIQTSETLTQEVEEMKTRPKDYKWFQEHFLVTESEWRKKMYENPPAPPQHYHWYNYKGLPEFLPEQDPYLSIFKQNSALSWIRFFLVPCGLIPTGYIVIFWDKVRAHMYLILLFLLPIVEAYPYMKQDYMWIIYVMDFISMLDMIIRAHTGYFERKTKGLVTHPLLTAKHYILGPFLVDLYGSLPAYAMIDNFLLIFGFDGPGHKNRLFAYFMRMNRLIGIYRYWNHKKAAIIKDFGSRNNWKIARFLFFYLILQTHFFACISIVLACPTVVSELLQQDGICYPNTWIAKGSPTLRMQAKGENVTGPHVYLFAVYYTATTSVGCGFGDFKPIDRLEKNIASVQLFLYIIVFTFVLALVASSRCHSDYQFLKFQQSMKYLIGWLTRENIDLKYTSRIVRHYDYYWMRTKGVSPEHLWPILYPTLRKDVMFDTYENVFRLVPEFDGVPCVFIREVLACIQLRYYLNHEIVIRRGDVCEFIYIIGSGNMIVKLGTEMDLQEDDTMQLGEGGVLGSMDPSVSRPLHDSTAICWTNVDMYFISRSDFMNILKKYPEVSERFIVPENKSRNLRIHHIFSQHGMEETKFQEKYQSQNLNLTANTTLKISLRKELNEVIATNEMEVKSRMSLVHKKSESLIRNHHNTWTEARSKYREAMHEAEQKRYGMDDMYEASILPVSKKFLILDAVCFWAAVVSSGVTGFQFTFKRFEWTFWILGFITDAIFIAKIILRFFITYYDEMGDLISHILEMEKGYLSSYDGFIMDFFTALPFELFTLIYTAVAPDKGDGQKQQIAFMFWASLRLNRLFRLFFVWKYIGSMLRYGGITLNLVYLKITRLLISTFIVLHWIVIIFHIFTVSFRDIADRLCQCNNSVCLEVDYATFIPSSWAETKKETGHRLCSPYVMTLYFMVSTFTTTGYGDILPITTFEIIFISLLALSSKVYVGVALADVLSGLQYFVDKSYHISAEAVLKSYWSWGISSFLIHRVKAYFNYAWQQNSGILLPELLIHAPEVHRLDICFEAYGHVLENCYLFFGCSMEFYKFVCVKFQVVWVLDGDCIVNQDELGDRIYFIHHGIVEGTRETFDENGETLDSKKHYLTRGCFGELNGLTGLTAYQRTYTAKTNVDLLYLTYEEAEKIFEVFPEEKTEILERLAAAYDTLIEDGENLEEDSSESDESYESTSDPATSS